MKTKPILFSTEMVQANLAGRKTNTRRIVDEKHYGFLEYAFKNKKNLADWISRTAKYQMGDVLWVRESYCSFISQSGEIKIHYKASVSDTFIEACKLYWKPSIHMPKEAARTFLKVLNVRVERLQDISEEDSIKEGCSLYGPFGEYKGAPHPSTKMFRAYREAKKAFQSIWEYIHGQGSWNKNPFVWVYEYEIIGKPENFLS